MSDFSQIGTKLRQLRLSKNMSQDRFGKKIGISGKTISAYETGRSAPPLRVLESISTAYSVDFVQLKAGKKNALMERLKEIKTALGEIETSIEQGLSF